MSAAVIALAFFCGLALSRLGLPPLVGFLVAGFALHGAGIPTPDSLHTIADLGVTLLLFTIGLKLKIKNLIKPEVWGATTLHLIGSVAFFTVGIACLALLGLVQGQISSWLVVAFALAFSSTVFAVKVLEDKGDTSSLYGRLAIGILVMQDIFAVLFLTFAQGKMPAFWAPALLALPLLRPVLYKLLDWCSNSELQSLAGLFLAMVAGVSLFEAAGLKPDLGALVMGMMVAGHSRADALSKTLFNLKELLLVGFFLSIGLNGLPDLPMLLLAIALVLLLPLKTGLYFWVLSLFGLRVRTGVLASLSLATYSEFGLIVAALGAKAGLLSGQWLTVIAIALSISFALASPLNTWAENVYRRLTPNLKRYEKRHLHPDDAPIDIGGAKVLIFGMGRLGTGAYDQLKAEFGEAVLGIDHAADKVGEHQEAGRQVLVGDATDSDFWSKIRHDEFLELVLLAMPNHHGNLFAAEELKERGYKGKVAAVAKFPDEVEELKAMGIEVFNIFEEAGAGFARHVLNIARLGPQRPYHQGL
ncbi:MAG: cation:proton antiporter family protein [Pseudomonadota bacterium]|uniref:Transporter (CPA2 family) n=1 Tax=Gallaecimonas pentaromativorans TaxID=584787 RepID=A0A3N1PC18_9GAMM|nr:cation:proton antiporter family protein [Gallaecimonas pentaromativorans]MED5525837.1 cation:proton antiporter family protein [Pseudomonadota bacterium]ROQ24931.1 transporter (CPA2 family) [Gallaecimonas pentaromativorans]